MRDQPRCSLVDLCLGACVDLEDQGVIMSTLLGDTWVSRKGVSHGSRP